MNGLVSNGIKTLSILAPLCLIGCTELKSTEVETTQMAIEPQAVTLADPAATEETVALYTNLRKLVGEHVLFGHQETLAYGVEWIDEPNQSDIKRVTGSHPAVYGWEVSGLALGDEHNIDGVSFKATKQWIREVYHRGGINTISWHMHNPVTGEKSWSKGDAVSQILPGGPYHDIFKDFLDAFAEFDRDLTVTNANGETVQVPIIFRPWHEHTGDWFWWGKGHTAEEDFVALWRFTVDYLTEEKNLHNLIFAYSPDRSRIDQ